MRDLNTEHRKTMDKEPLVRMEGIGKSFSGVQVLADVSFELMPGEVHILAGENGAGKTTLIKILAGVHTDYDGHIKINDRSVQFKSPHDAARYGISAIHQEMSLVNAMTVADNIFLGREETRSKFWMDFKSQTTAARKLLKGLNIDIDLSQPVEVYPLSMRQMFEIAKARVYDAKIVIMDEPTSALNDVEVQRLFHIIEELKKKGCGIFYISHRLEEIYKIGDRISVLRDGNFVGTALTTDLSADNLIKWMVGREIKQQFPERSPGKDKERLKVKNLCIPDPSGTKQWAVEGASFKVRAGEILGIAGLQGSGKSELLHGIFGTHGKITSGGLWLDGEPFTIRSPKHSIDSGIALLTNNRKETGIIPEMDIVQNISLASLSSFSSVGIMNPQKEKETAQAQAKDFDIRTFSINQNIVTLSGGNQQKVVLAKWIQSNPKVLLLDEPTRGIDVSAKHDIYLLMNRWTSQGISIILITSELPELLAMSDRIIVLHRGKIKAMFSGDESTQENVIHAAMGEETTLS